ncbi:hypothetical protein D3C84_798850 [compost metagenome]
MAGEELCQQRRHQILAERLGHRQPHLAARVAHQPLADRHRGFGGDQHLPAAFEHLRPCGAQAQAAGGALQQAQAERLLQLGDLPAQRRRAAALQARRGGEAAAFHHADEAGHQWQQLIALIRVHGEQVLCIRAGLSRRALQ